MVKILNFEYFSVMSVYMGDTISSEFKILFNIYEKQVYFLLISYSLNNA